MKLNKQGESSYDLAKEKYMKRFITVVIAAGGVGRRMNHHKAKQYIEVNDKALLAYTIEAFETNEDIDAIVLVVGEEDITYVKQDIIKKYRYSKVFDIVTGGQERRDSVYNGLIAIPGETSHVLVHDGARPLVSQEEITKSVEGAIKYRACVLGAKVKDTIKVTNEEAYVISTPIRKNTYQIQTPQAFEKGLLLEAYKRSYGETYPVTDDAMIVERYSNQQVKVIESSYKNIKITTPEDLLMMNQFLQED